MQQITDKPPQITLVSPQITHTHEPKPLRRPMTGGGDMQWEAPLARMARGRAYLYTQAQRRHDRRFFSVAAALHVLGIDDTGGRASSDPFCIPMTFVVN